MNRRTVIIILGSAVLIVVVGIMGYFFFSSPSGQAWERDWIGNPIGLTAIATVAAAVGTIGTVAVALFVTAYERKKAQEDREEGRRQFLEAQYATNRPLLIPVPTLESFGGSPSIDWNLPSKPLRIHNVGTGIATNIWGVFLPPEPILTISHQYSIHLQTPLAIGAMSREGDFFNREGTLFNCDDKIGGHTLCVPKERSRRGKGDLIIARLTLTCSDIFGRKHASIFDYTDRGAWINVTFIPNIEHDLGEMDEAKRIELSKDAKNPSSPDPT